MILKRHASIILISILVCLLFGCANKITSENNKNIEVVIKPGISEYSESMSSAPGIPLTPEVIKNEYDGTIKFHWIAEYGIFLDLQPAFGKINELGSDIRINNRKIYLRPDSTNETNKIFNS